jgi:hypothetical protein
MRKLITIAVAVAAAAIFVVPAVANAGTTTSNSLSYEFDNGNFALAGGATWYWELQKNSAAINTTVTDYGYADAGVVVDLGSANNFTGITAVTSGPMATNIWIGDGSDANTPGQYSSANFSYGFQQPDGSFYMTTGPQAGNYLTAADIAKDFAGYEVYAWVGLVYSGQSVSGSVSSINGHATGNRTVSFTNNGDGTVTAVLH